MSEACRTFKLTPCVFVIVSAAKSGFKPDAVTIASSRHRLHPGITQEVASNESQRDPKPVMAEALIYDVLFVVRWFLCRIEKGS